MNKIYLLFATVLFLFPTLSFSQVTFEGQKVTDFSRNSELNNQFAAFDLYEFNVQDFRTFVDSRDAEQQINIKLGEDYDLNTSLNPFDLFDENASIRVFTDDGEMLYPVPRNTMFWGIVNGSNYGVLKLYTNNNFFRATINEGDDWIYISSLSRYIDNVDEDVFIVFKESDHLAGDVLGECSANSHSSEEIDIHNHNTEEERSAVDDCFEASIGIAHDYLMYLDQGSTIQGCIDHAVTVMLDVETNYELNGAINFADGLSFNIVEQVISICSDCDPWTSSTDLDDLLGDFQSWGITNNGFTPTVNFGQLWTDRDMDGTTVGYASTATGLMCNNRAFHWLQDYTNTDWQLRVLTAHEMGHNLGFPHSSAGFIMNSSVNNTTSWAASTQALGNAEIASAGASCLPDCFVPDCNPVEDVSVTNIDADGFDISWTATTEGDYRLRVRDQTTNTFIYDVTTSSNAHTNINPAGWVVCHDYKVSVENDCGVDGFSAPVSALVNKSDQGCSDFSADECIGWNSLTIAFTDESQNATSWDWDFGDGNSSTMQSPSHTYNAPGVYSVELSINSNAHTTTKTNFVTVLPSKTPPYDAADGGNMNTNDFGTKSSTCNNPIWEKGVPTSNYFSNAAGDNSWVTYLDADTERENEDAYLYSPDFDFSADGEYTLSFELGMEITFCNGPFAVQVQYSTDNGGAWTTLGAETDASWYNRGPTTGCPISASIFSDQRGWTFTNQDNDYNYDVSSLEGNASVIFRFAFGIRSNFNSDAGYTRDGAKVDNVEIAFLEALPVEVTNFDGKLDKDKVLLNWQTASEVNNDYFLVEQSIDGRNFEKLGAVNGMGNSSSLQTYTLLDPTPSVGINYYRLTQYDFDGTFEVVSKIVAIEYYGEKDLSIQPNPTKGDQINLIYQTDQQGELEIQIFNVNGQLIKNLRFETLAARNIFNINIEELSNGVYILKSTQSDRSQSLRFVKTK